MISDSNESADTYQKLLRKIASQLEDRKHPFRILQHHFDEYVEKTYTANGPPSAAVMAPLTKDIADVVQAMCYTTIYFYNLKLKLAKRSADLFLGVMTDLIVRGSTRKLVMSLLRDELSGELKVFSAQAERFRRIRLDQLKISPYLAFNVGLRSSHKQRQTEGHSPKKPRREVLSRSMEELRKIRELELPNQKLGQLQVFCDSLLREIDDFWDSFDVKREDLVMDSDSLLSLFIFTMIKSEYLDAIVDQRFMDLFITDVDKKSVKGYYLVTMGIAFEWIKSQNFETFSLVPRLSHRR